MIFLSDPKRHLICIPYSIENLHTMANKLGIKRCWFHKTHYDIPKRRIAEISQRTTQVTPRHIAWVIKFSQNELT